MKDKMLESKERLLHIQKAIADIERFVSNYDAEEFIKNDLLQNAVLLQFIIIGEAIRHVDIVVLNQYPYGIRCGPSGT